MSIIQSSSLSHTGNVRSTNEDAIFSDDNAAIWAVADGMGGHHAGDYASQCITAHLQQAATLYKGKALVDCISAVIETAHHEIFQHSQQLPNQPIIGSTIVVLVMEADRYHCFWSGDSRCYLLREERLAQLTRDHTEAEALIDEQQSAYGSANDYIQTPAEKIRAENTLIHAIGIDKQTPHIEYISDYIYENDRFFLCSDGVNKIYEDNEIKQHLSTNNIDTININLIEQAPNGHIPDNLSSIIIEI